MIVATSLMLLAATAQASPPPAPPIVTVPATPTAVDPQRLAAAQQLLELMHLDQQYDGVFSRMIPVMTIQLFNSLKDNVKVPVSVRSSLADPAKAAEAERIFAEEASNGFKGRYVEMKTATAREYAAAFSLEDLTQLLGFYHSPVGQKTLTVLPALQAKLMPIGMAAGAQVGQAALKRTFERMKIEPASPKA